MAITKKEQARIDAEIEQLKTRCAFRLTEPALPDIFPKYSDKKIVSGFIPYGGTGVGTHYCVTDGSVCRLAYDSTQWPSLKNDGSGSRHCEPMFSKRVEALRSLRNRIENECAQKLRQIDKMIEKEIANPTPRPDDIKKKD